MTSRERVHEDERRGGQGGNCVQKWARNLGNGFLKDAGAGALGESGKGRGEKQPLTHQGAFDYGEHQTKIVL